MLRLRQILLTKKHCLSLLINFNLLINCFDAFLNSSFTWILEVSGRFIEALDDGLDCLGLQFGPLLEVQEVQADHLVEELLQVLVVIQVATVVQLRELQDHVHHFRFVRARQAVMLLPIEYPLGALIDHLGADRILTVVQRRVEVSVLLRHDQDCLEVLHLLRLVGCLNGSLDVAPDVRGVVTVQVDELLLH